MTKIPNRQTQLPICLPQAPEGIKIINHKVMRCIKRPGAGLCLRFRILVIEIYPGKKQPGQVL